MRVRSNTSICTCKCTCSICDIRDKLRASTRIRALNYNHIFAVKFHYNPCQQCSVFVKKAFCEQTVRQTN